MNKRKRITTVWTLAAVAMAVFAGPAQAAPFEGQLGILTPETLEGNNPATGEPWAPGDQYRFAFFTSGTTTATSADIATYNTWVQGLANLSPLNIGADDGAAWKVIGSTATVDARDNTATNPTVNGPGHAIFLLDGSTVVANNYADLWDGEIQNIINLTEQGAISTHWPFTGTYTDGTSVTGKPTSFSPLGGGNEVNQGNSANAAHWVWRTWTSAPATEYLQMYALSDPLIIVGQIDPNIPDVDAGADMITWSDEPVTLDPNVVEKAGSDWTSLTYAWSAEPSDGVEFSNPDIKAPTVTITKTPVFVPFVANASFEDPPLDEDDYTWQDVPGWTSIGHADGDEGVGVWNTTIADFDPVIAPVGENVLYTEYFVGGVGGVAQILGAKFEADTAYTMTVEVGNSNYYYFSGYKVQLLAGGTVIAEDNDTLWPGYKLWATSTVAYTYNAADAALVGEPLEIRLLSLGLDKDGPGVDDVIGVEFDNVTLLIDGESGTYTYDPEPITVILTLAVNDEGREGNPVTNTMTIDVYDNSCLAAIDLGMAMIDRTDIDGDCITDFADFAVMATTWLDDYALTEPVPN